MAISLFQADELVSRANVNQRITDIKNCFSGTSLWQNVSGYKGTITLSDNYNNYDFVYVQAMNNDIATANIFRPNVTNKLLVSNLYADENTPVTGLYYRGTILEFSGTTVTLSRNGSYWLKKDHTVDDGWTAASDSNTAGIYITNIMGYKY